MTSPVELRQWFDMVDRDRSGAVDSAELQTAMAAAGLHFSLHTAAMMIRMYDRARKGTIDFREFSLLHQFILSVQGSFNVFDGDRNGVLDRIEVSKALNHNGFALDEPAFKAVFESFDPARNGFLRLDDFIAMASFLSASRSMFQAFDFDRRGHVQLDFGQFVYAASHLR
mmetsp:Transcript_15849/g.31808  ORF Transcript_15849/g.31808 Transcript_15849/m.31808 type:complete len:170 (-) Transcript_15849:510-1019(-)|eukprot:CAMPEP_0184680828 /NCGR_PEP_ID=MMETSP0312-20130426/3746_1 /TAXON_ID=31354 /ORGANISM="Compsopogon coeruleus, Strain SAG 36.94" /LENGTH=169 /DNA_ID=CAMNT_0027131215 /DNA_START=137 /DNA_END=646 /DNA_ORIENTATION=-